MNVQDIVQEIVLQAFMDWICGTNSQIAAGLHQLVVHLNQTLRLPCSPLDLID